MSNSIIKIGTRGSKLALYQANKVKENIQEIFPHLSTEIKIIKTKGDKILDVALSKIGDKGLFTKELEVELYKGNIDMAVHSIKDIPTLLPEGLKLGAVLERGVINDALVSLKKKSVKDLTTNDRIATSSLRRIASLLHLNNQFTIIDIRGNVNTRLQKMKDGYCDAMIMAAAGLQRLELDEYITEIISPDVIFPAVGQGAIGIEIRKNDETIEKIIQKLNHHLTWHAITAERAFMHTLEGGCQVPVGCYSFINDNILVLKGFVASIDGKRYIKETLEGPILDAELIGIQLAEKILKMGGDNILQNIRKF